MVSNFKIFALVLILLFLLVLISTIATIVWLWAILNCIQSDLKTEEKIIWIIIIILLNFIGALLYFSLRKKSEDKMKKTNKTNKTKKLYRSRENRMIAGVCGGFGEYLDTDPTILRVVWVVATIFTGFFIGIIAYIAAAILIPEK